MNIDNISMIPSNSNYESEIDYSDDKDFNFNSGFSPLKKTDGFLTKSGDMIYAFNNAGKFFDFSPDETLFIALGKNNLRTYPL